MPEIKLSSQNPPVPIHLLDRVELTLNAQIALEYAFKERPNADLLASDAIRCWSLEDRRQVVLPSTYWSWKPGMAP